jgi:hypothetical protein
MRSSISVDTPHRREPIHQYPEFCLERIDLLADGFDFGVACLREHLLALQKSRRHLWIVGKIALQVRKTINVNSEQAVDLPGANLFLWRRKFGKPPPQASETDPRKIVATTVRY